MTNSTTQTLKFHQTPILPIFKTLRGSENVAVSSTAVYYLKRKTVDTVRLKERFAEERNRMGDR